MFLIVCDQPGQALAARTASLLSQIGYPSSLMVKARYPIADSMSAYLLALNANPTLVFLVISDSPEAIRWIWPEIRLNPRLYPQLRLILSSSVGLPGSDPAKRSLLESDLSPIALTAWLERHGVPE